ncbi:MAG: methyltransferase domain-containing protein [Chthoniobacteraceae bacterium]
MKWLAKALAIKTLSSLPGGATLYNWGQKHVTRSLDPSPPRVRQKIDVAMRYLDALSRLGSPLDFSTTTHIDVGSGWHPTIPLFFFACGCERQWLFDVAPLLDAGLLQKTVAAVRTVLTDEGHPAHARVKRLPSVRDAAALEEALRDLGMTYTTPYDDVLGAMSGTADLITSTQALQHVDREIMRGIFGRVFRALKPGGHFLATVHLKDLYAPLGGSGPYNHLRFSPAMWRACVNSRLISFNRLKAPDFRELLEAAGFALPHFEVEHATADDLAKLDLIPVHSSFARYSREDLAARHLFFVARKP